MLVYVPGANGTVHNHGGISLAKPHGRPPKVGSAIEVSFSDHDRRLVDQLCRVMNVGYSECFHILLHGALDLARQANGNNIGSPEGTR